MVFLHPPYLSDLTSYYQKTIQFTIQTRTLLGVKADTINNFIETRDINKDIRPLSYRIPHSLCSSHILQHARYTCTLVPLYLLTTQVSHFLWVLSRVIFGASLVAQWLRICLPMQGTRVRALVWEDPTCRGATRPVSHNY